MDSPIPPIRPDCRHALVICIAKYDNQPPSDQLYEVLNDLDLSMKCLTELNFKITSPSSGGRLTKERLEKAVIEFLDGFAADVKGYPGKIPFAAVIVSCHGYMENQAHGLPRIWTSDMQGDSEGFDIATNIVAELNAIKRWDAEGNAQAIDNLLVCDCCRTCKQHDVLWNRPVPQKPWRLKAKGDLPPCHWFRNNWYFLFSCDRGCETPVLPGEHYGMVIKAVMTLLPQDKKLSTVLDEAAVMATREGYSRPWVELRPGKRRIIVGTRRVREGGLFQEAGHKFGQLCTEVSKALPSLHPSDVASSSAAGGSSGHVAIAGGAERRVVLLLGAEKAGPAALVRSLSGPCDSASAAGKTLHSDTDLGGVSCHIVAAGGFPLTPGQNLPPELVHEFEVHQGVDVLVLVLAHTDPCICNQELMDASQHKAPPMLLERTIIVVYSDDDMPMEPCVRQWAQQQQCRVAGVVFSPDLLTAPDKFRDQVSYEVQQVMMKHKGKYFDPDLQEAREKGIIAWEVMTSQIRDPQTRRDLEEARQKRYGNLYPSDALRDVAIVRQRERMKPSVQQTLQDYTRAPTPSRKCCLAAVFMVATASVFSPCIVEVFTTLQCDGSSSLQGLVPEYTRLEEDFLKGHVHNSARVLCYAVFLVRLSYKWNWQDPSLKLVLAHYLGFFLLLVIFTWAMIPGDCLGLPDKVARVVVRMSELWILCGSGVCIIILNWLVYRQLEAANAEEWKLRVLTGLSRTCALVLCVPPLVVAAGLLGAYEDFSEVRGIAVVAVLVFCFSLFSFDLFAGWILSRIWWKQSADTRQRGDQPEQQARGQDLSWSVYAVATSCISTVVVLSLYPLQGTPRSVQRNVYTFFLVVQAMSVWWLSGPVTHVSDAAAIASEGQRRTQQRRTASDELKGGMTEVQASLRELEAQLKDSSGDSVKDELLLLLKSNLDWLSMLKDTCLWSLQVFDAHWEKLQELPKLVCFNTEPMAPSSELPPAGVAWLERLRHRFNRARFPEELRLDKDKWPMRLHKDGCYGRLLTREGPGPLMMTFTDPYDLAVFAALLAQDGAELLQEHTILEVSNEGCMDLSPTVAANVHPDGSERAFGLQLVLEDVHELWQVSEFWRNHVERACNPSGMEVETQARETLRSAGQVASFTATPCMCFVRLRASFCLQALILASAAVISSFSPLFFSGERCQDLRDNMVSLLPEHIRLASAFWDDHLHHFLRHTCSACFLVRLLFTLQYRTQDHFFKWIMAYYVVVFVFRLVHTWLTTKRDCDDDLTPEDRRFWVEFSEVWSVAGTGIWTWIMNVLVYHRLKAAVDPAAYAWIINLLVRCGLRAHGGTPFMLLKAILCLMAVLVLVALLLLALQKSFSGMYTTVVVCGSIFGLITLLFNAWAAMTFWKLWLQFQHEITFAVSKGRQAKWEEIRECMWWNFAAVVASCASTIVVYLVYFIPPIPRLFLRELVTSDALLNDASIWWMATPCDDVKALDYIRRASEQMQESKALRLKRNTRKALVRMALERLDSAWAVNISAQKRAAAVSQLDKLMKMIIPVLQQPEARWAPLKNMQSFKPEEVDRHCATTNNGDADWLKELVHSFNRAQYPADVDLPDDLHLKLHEDGSQAQIATQEQGKVLRVVLDDPYELAVFAEYVAKDSKTLARSLLRELDETVGVHLILQASSTTIHNVQLVLKDVDSLRQAAERWQEETKDNSEAQAVEKTADCTVSVSPDFGGPEDIHVHRFDDPAEVAVNCACTGGKAEVGVRCQFPFPCAGSCQNPGMQPEMQGGCQSRSQSRQSNKSSVSL